MGLLVNRNNSIDSYKDKVINVFILRSGIVLNVEPHHAPHGLRCCVQIMSAK